MKTERPWRDNVRQWEPYIHAFSALDETPSEGIEPGPLSGMAVGMDFLAEQAADASNPWSIVVPGYGTSLERRHSSR